METHTQDGGLNENHVRHVVVTFRYMDELLAKAESIMASAGSPSPFQEYANDTTPLQRKVTHDYVMRIRELMRRNLDELHIPRPAPVSGARTAAHNAVTFADIALAEMESQRMGGYGKLPDVAAKRIDEIAAELRAAIDRLGDYLAQSSGADLQSRLERLGKIGNGIPLLRELERIITAHGLVEFRQSVEMLLERLENATLEIGVFGRVSSGKSSLLNHLLGSEYLPVGVTPVTAVPTRITFGSHPQVLLKFADARSQVIELSALAEFATEQQNPGNAKHVSRIRVQVPAPTLREGITFVDTPGLGSLATSGAEETVAYLPRCDLGIVLVDPASTLTTEDLRVLQTICLAGGTTMVLVSKADLLNAPDRRRVLDYVKQQTRTELGLELPVHLVSVMGEDVRLCDEWFHEQLRPLLDQHHEHTSLSIRRKIGGLREALVSTLKRRLGAGTSAPSPIERTRLGELDGELRIMPQMLESARHAAEEQARSLRDLKEAIIETAANEIAERWRHHSETLDAAGVLSDVAARLVREASAKTRQAVEEPKTRVADTFDSAARLLPSMRTALHDLPRPAALPLPDATALAQQPGVARPAIVALFGKRAVRSLLRTRLHERMAPELESFLSLHSRRLEDWVKNSLSGLEAAFSANAGILRAQLEQRLQTNKPGEDQDGIHADIELLERWDDRSVVRHG